MKVSEFSFGVKTLKEWRILSGKTQQQVAEETGTTTSSIWRWEQSPESLQNATYKKLKALADAVGCQPFQFDYGDDERGSDDV